MLPSNSDPEMQPLAVDFTRAAKLTSLSTWTLRKYAREGRLRVVRCGRRVVIPLTALQLLVKEGIPSEDARVPIETSTKA